MDWPRLRLPPGLGGAFWLALLLLGLVESALHSERVIHQFRAVFALGRAYDKLQYVERNPPPILFLGNSRIDNGVDPRTFSRAWADGGRQGFNLGLPGANALVYHGEVRRLDARGLLGGEGVQVVVLGLDESALQEDNSLGYVGFLADRRALWETGRYRDWLGSYLRLWSYSGNLRQLREPDKALRFIEASVRSLDPVGGAAALHLGYRAGFGAAQNRAQLVRQETAAQLPPAPGVEAFLWRTIVLLKARGVRVFVAVPPLRDRPSAFFDASPAAAPYRALLARLRQGGATVLPIATGYAPAEFVNAGHLNNRGAQRYSAELGRLLAERGV
ncbi:MAG TPA: hypothetical protein PLQ95_12175 [Thiobacillus sp.]|nr:hypothetical protein [Thiobacillus sp.]